MSLAAIRARLQEAKSDYPHISRADLRLLLDVAEAVGPFLDELRPLGDGSIAVIHSHADRRLREALARLDAEQLETERDSYKLLGEWEDLIRGRDVAEERVRVLESELRSASERCKRSEEALTKAEVTFNDFVMALHLLGHEPMAQAARIARDASGEALRGQE